MALLTKVLVIFSLLLCTSSQSQSLPNTRRMLDAQKQDQSITTSLSTKNQTKPIKPQPDSVKTQFKRLNSTSKPSNSTRPSSYLTQKPSDPNKPIKPIPTKSAKTQLNQKQGTEKNPNPSKTQKPKQPNWTDQQDEFDFVSDFKDLPTKIHQNFFPDLERISESSNFYIAKANKEITDGFEPIVGNKYASTISKIISLAFILIPLILVSLLFGKIRAYFSLQKLLIFIQVYLSIYFSVLSLSSLATGLEPMKFFYATSRPTYACVLALQALGYVLYLLLLLMYLVLVFSSGAGLVSKLLGLAQTFVGFSVGLHYYATVLHRMVMHQPPRTSWRVHGTYATCFLVICLLARAEGRKKAYLEEGGEEGKKS